MTTLDATHAQTWLRRWDAQQSRYVADREEWFAVIGDVVAHTVGERAATVVDLGCGPGSLAGRLAVRLPPEVRVIGVDSDPLLLALGRAHYGNVVEFVDADLTGDWLAHLPDVLDAAVSTTALHWLDPAALAAVYADLASRLRSGGVFVDGDHLRLGDPALDELGVLVRERRAIRAGVADNEEWTAWWDAVGADPALRGLLDERTERALTHHGSNELSVRQHRELLLAAGFASVGTVWQSGDDQVLVAIR